MSRSRNSVGAIQEMPRRAIGRPSSPGAGRVSAVESGLSSPLFVHDAGAVGRRAVARAWRTRHGGRHPGLRPRRRRNAPPGLGGAEPTCCGWSPPMSRLAGRWVLVPCSTDTISDRAQMSHPGSP